MSAGRDIYQLGFQISPIILVDGIAQGIPGSGMPIVAITESINFLGGLLAGGTEASLDNFFAHFSVIPGTQLINNEYGKYPFANQVTAANAVIVQPTSISLQMDCNVTNYLSRLAIMTALQSTLQQHTNKGGSYVVATPAAIMTNMLLERLTDISDGDPKRQLTRFRWDFFKPLITLQQAQAAQSQLMSKISAGVPTDGSWSGTGQTVGFPPSLATGASIPAASGLPAAGAAGPYMLGGPVTP